PLSNPISCAEATPQDIYDWTHGKAIVGVGSPFPVARRGGQLFRADQTNNAYIFPGVGLGVLASGAKRISDTMFLKSPTALASLSPRGKDPSLNLLPPISALRDVAAEIAIAVARQAIDEGLAPPTAANNLAQIVRARMWQPRYLPYRRVMD